MHLQVILVGGKQNASIKARHGLTPPMRDAARRMFDQTPAVDQKIMQKLEDDLITIAQVLLLPMPCSNGSVSGVWTLIWQTIEALHEAIMCPSGKNCTWQ